MAGLRGVNLGGWLVLERWMTPSLFGDLKAPDEYSLCLEPHSNISAMLRKHRDTFITKKDFVWISERGLSAVRIPVGYWIFGGEEPYIGAIGYLDKAFKWANETGLKIIIDLHGAPGSQNGWDHSGRAGMMGWHKDSLNVAKTLHCLNRLAERYKDVPALVGIELLNEPRWNVPTGTLNGFYEKAYSLLRKQLKSEVLILFSDGFRPRRWRKRLKAATHPNTVIDIHRYQVFTPKDKQLDIAGHLSKTLGTWQKQLAKEQKYHPVIIGEWSAALDGQSFKGLSDVQKRAASQAYAAAQLITFEQTAGWFYWSYKLEYSSDWSFRNCVERGILPINFRDNQAAK